MTLQHLGRSDGETTQFLRAGYDRTQFGLSWSSQFVEGSLGNKHSVACMEHLQGGLLAADERVSSQAARLTSGKIRLRTPCPRPKEEDPRTLKKLDSMCSGRDCGLAGVRAPQVHLVICYSGSDVARLLWRIKSGHSSQARLGCVLSHSAARRFGGVLACSRAARLLVRELGATPAPYRRSSVVAVYLRQPASGASPGGALCRADE